MHFKKIFYKKRLKQYLYTKLLSFLLVVLSSQAYALDTLTITRDTLTALPNCLEYRVNGMCFWLVPGVISRIEITLKIKHFLPDAVVSVFPLEDSNPWDFARISYDKIAYETGNAVVTLLTRESMGHGDMALQTRDNRVSFKEVDIIGHPALPALSQQVPYVMHTSTVMPLAPYYLSMLDVLGWRSGLASLDPRSLDPVSHNIGSVMAHWGSIFPREGFVLAAHDAQAAAILAMRAGHIATHGGSHVTQNLGTRCGTKCSAAKVMNNDNRVRWQLLYPKKSNQCVVFGEELFWGDVAANRETGSYVFNLWREYDGCVEHPRGIYLGHT